ncbi:hypothetical protein AB0E63_04865 [Kribbella sp. NPDC026596]|uniref:hypothetical protein n=1 Tax=Kribbella sp. NPDC026596 TaxID=3155122 RepID=UPI0034018AC3
MMVTGAALVVGLMAGPGPAMLAEMFPTRARDIQAWYVMVTCAVSVVALLTLRGDDHRRELRD